MAVVKVLSGKLDCFGLHPRDADDGSCNLKLDGASSSSAAFNNAGPNTNNTSAASVFWPSLLEVGCTPSFNSDCNSVLFWPAPSGQVEKGSDVANMNLSAPLSPSLRKGRACTDIDGCTNVQLDDVGNGFPPDEYRQDLGASEQSQ